MFDITKIIFWKAYRVEVVAEEVEVILYEVDYEDDEEWEVIGSYGRMLNKWERYTVEMLGIKWNTIEVEFIANEQYKNKNWDDNLWTFEIVDFKNGNIMIIE